MDKFILRSKTKQGHFSIEIVNAFDWFQKLYSAIFIHIATQPTKYLANLPNAKPTNQPNS